jgi:hypothetical protein
MKMRLLLLLVLVPALSACGNPYPPPRGGYVEPVVYPYFYEVRGVRYYVRPVHGGGWEHRDGTPVPREYHASIRQAKR